MRKAIYVLTTLLLVLCSFLSGVAFTFQNVQTANGLIDAGFLIVDPEGFQVERFEGIDYWNDGTYASK